MVTNERKIEILERLLEITQFERDSCYEFMDCLPTCIDDLLGDDYKVIKKNRMESNRLYAELEDKEPEYDPWECPECGDDKDDCECNSDE